jgi:hypothetical protein
MSSKAMFWGVAGSWSAPSSVKVRVRNSSTVSSPGVGGVGVGGVGVGGVVVGSMGDVGAKVGGRVEAVGVGRSVGAEVGAPSVGIGSVSVIFLSKGAKACRSVINSCTSLL